MFFIEVTSSVVIHYPEDNLLLFHGIFCLIISLNHILATSRIYYNYLSVDMIIQYLSIFLTVWSFILLQSQVNTKAYD